ncbi:hypothetical protein TWF788_011204 [Orbilia oligospora]|uniref:Uncharacterized protein n=1 Tax=Orbilia oligospora TaxID=2813651 RepID=A0A7C8U088_ORBOL|nr:hypothetical protein TWF788_011204 [Orbilia oligospora]KAF3213528.1 hypothetical protein TWF679_005344 [Orbilia oligospora]
MPSLVSSLTSVGLLGAWLSGLGPASPALAAAAVGHRYQPVIRDRISSYNVSFDSEEFDTLGDLDWRPLDEPYEGLLWKNFRVGASRHFFQFYAGKNAFALVPLDRANRIQHENDPSLSCLYKDSDISSFGIDSLMFGCALRSGVPVQCNIDFKGTDRSGNLVGFQSAEFSPPYARMNDIGRLEAGKARLQQIRFKPGFSKLTDLRFSISNYSVLYSTDPPMQTQVPLDVAYGGSLMLIINRVEYITNSTAATESVLPSPSTSAPVLEKRGKHVTDCFDMNGDTTYNSISVPWKDLQYDGFYNVKHLLGNFDEKCDAKSLNASTGHLFAPGLVPYTDKSASIFPSVGIDYFGSKRKDMSIKSFYLGCEQFLDPTSVLDTTTPCTIGLVGLVRQKKGNKPQDLIFQQVSIARPAGAAPEDVGFAFVDLIDGDHLTKLYFVLISADPQATSVAIILDNFTYLTREGKGPQTGNKAVAASPDSRINEIVQAISDGHGRETLGLPRKNLRERQSDIDRLRRSPQQHEGLELPSPWISNLNWARSQTQSSISTFALPTSILEPPYPSRSGKVWPRGNSTFTFEDATNADPKTGFFKITEESTAPFQFGPEWKGRHQDVDGNPKDNVIFNNATWAFGPVNATRQNFAFTEVAWANRGTPEWNNTKPQIRIPSGPGHPIYQIREFMTACYPAITTNEDKARLNMLGGGFECHFTVFGYKEGSKEDPAEHAIDFPIGSWEHWRWDTFPKNFKGVNVLEFHATYASTRNVRIFVDDIKFESF